MKKRAAQSLRRPKGRGEKIEMLPCERNRIAPEKIAAQRPCFARRRILPRTENGG